MKRIAVIPARGASKRLPYKNVLDFAGKPMIAWTIEAARESGVVDRVIVSTDDKGIADVACQWGGEVPFLRDQHADDNSVVSLATIRCLQQASDWYEEQYDVVLQLMPNCPLRRAEDIINQYEAFRWKECQAQLSCFRFGWMNPWWAVQLDEAGFPSPLFKETLTNRSQDLPDLYCPTGAVWISKRDALIEHGNFYQPDTRFEPMSWVSAIDIDDGDDLEMARALARINGLALKS